MSLTASLVDRHGRPCRCAKLVFGTALQPERDSLTLASGWPMARPVNHQRINPTATLGRDRQPAPRRNGQVRRNPQPDISRVAGVCVRSTNSATCRSASLDAKRKALPVSCLSDRMVER